MQVIRKKVRRQPLKRKGRKEGRVRWRGWKEREAKGETKN